MTHKVRLEGGKDFLKGISIADINVVEMSTVGNIVAASTTEVIDNGHLPAVGEALFSEVTADESGSASDEQTHGCYPV